MSNVKEIELPQMGPLRDGAQRLSQKLQKKLQGHLLTLTPLFSPRKVLGEFMESAFKDKVLGAEENFKRIETQFKEISRSAFNMAMKLSTPVATIKNQLEIYPWQYLYELSGDKAQTITISTPTRWVLAYTSALDLERLLKAKVDGESLRAEEVRELIVNNLTLVKLMELSPGIKSLFEDLRFTVTIETSPVSGNLPYVVLNTPLVAFRPQDEVIKTVTQLSGLPVFEELIDIERISELDDPFKSAVWEASTSS